MLQTDKGGIGNGSNKLNPSGPWLHISSLVSPESQTGNGTAWRLLGNTEDTDAAVPPRVGISTTHGTTWHTGDMELNKNTEMVMEPA